MNETKKSPPKNIKVIKAGPRSWQILLDGFVKLLVIKVEEEKFVAIDFFDHSQVFDFDSIESAISSLYLVEKLRRKL